MAIIARNLKKDGIEITFESRQPQEVKMWLSENRFRWSKFSNLYWKKFSEKDWTLVHEYFNAPLPKGSIASNPELPIGTAIEKEHTADPAVAEKIAADHLKENPNYYSEPKPKDWAEKELKKESEKDNITSFEEYLRQSRVEYGWKNNEAIHEKYKIHLLRNAYADEIAADNFGTGIARLFADAEEGINRNLSKVKTSDESSFLYGKKKVAELMEKAKAEGKDIKADKKEKDMSSFEKPVPQVETVKEEEENTPERFHNLTPAKTLSDFETNIEAILEQYSGREMGSIQVESYLNQYKDTFGKEYLAKHGIKGRDELKTFTARLQSKVREGKGKERSEALKQMKQEKSDNIISEIEKMALEANAEMQEEIKRRDDEENINRGIKRIESDQAMQEVEQEIRDENKVGSMRPEFGDILKGREIQLSMPNGEKRNAVFAIVELDNIIASHNEENFHSEPLYPKNASGNNINDRNYSGDLSAQKAVMDYARELEPERLITTSRTPSGTPIITKDGFVVSGNNRTMSLKLSVKQYPDNYKEYVKFLSEEIESFGFPALKFNSFSVGGGVKGYVVSNPKEINELPLSFTHPALVRIDLDFPEYTTQELAKYNKDTKKSERPIDKAIKLSNILRDNSRCADIIAATVGEYDTFSEFYVNVAGQKKLAKTLVECNLLTEQELPAYFSDTTFTETGKEFIENLLAALILDREALTATEQPGVKSIRQKLITALPVLMKNASLPEGSLKQKINDAVILQYNMKGSTFADFIRQRTMFGTIYDKQTVYLNRLIDSGKLKFKAAIEGYNDAIMQNQGASLFGEKPSNEDIFNHWIVGGVSETDKKLIEGSDVVSKDNKSVDKVPLDVISPDYNKINENISLDYETFIKGIIRQKNTGGKFEFQKSVPNGNAYETFYSSAQDEKVAYNELYEDYIAWLKTNQTNKFISVHPSTATKPEEEFKLSLEQKAIIQPEWDKMQGFIKETDDTFIKDHIIIGTVPKYDEKAEIIPHDNWRDHLIKARTYAIELFTKEELDEMRNKDSMDWGDRDSIVRMIDRKLNLIQKPELRKELISGDYDGFKIYAVDGEVVRRDHIEFTMGGHGYVYDYIPKDEVWIDENLNDKPDDMGATIKHEMVEVRKMRDEGLSYEEAHELANAMEKKVRNEPEIELPPIQIRPKKYARLNRPFNNRQEGDIGEVMGQPNMFVSDILFEGEKSNQRIDNGYLEFIKDEPIVAPKKLNPFIALFGGKQFELYAESLWDAKKKAIEHFKPAKSKEHLVSVHLAEESKEDIKKREAKEQPKDETTYLLEGQSGIQPKLITLQINGEGTKYSDYTFDEANRRMRFLLDKADFSDLAYNIEYSDGESLSGSIDCEPRSFFAKEQYPLSRHLKTFWGNVAKASPSAIVKQDDIDYAQKIYQNYNLGTTKMIGSKPSVVIVSEEMTYPTQTEEEVAAIPEKDWKEPAVSKPEVKDIFPEIAAQGDKDRLIEEIQSLEKNIRNGVALMAKPSFTGDVRPDIEKDRQRVIKKQQELATLLGISFTDIYEYIQKQTTVTHTKEGHTEPTISTFSLERSDYSNDFQLNKGIERLIDAKWNDKLTDWSAEELEFITGYSGYGGLDEFGEIGKGSLYEFYTPESVIEKMWGLAYKYGYKDGRICEPSAGIALFLSRNYVKSSVIKDAYEINKYSAKIIRLLYPETNVNDGAESKYFEQLFIKNNYTVRGNVSPVHDLVIGNPPYGEAQGLYMGMGEKTYTHAKNYIDYFIFRGLDLLKKDGLLIYIIGAEVAAGGTPWLDQGTSKCKELIAAKGKLLDAYRLPEGLFARTNVVTDIVVFKKKG